MNRTPFTVDALASCPPGGHPQPRQPTILATPCREASGGKAASPCAAACAWPEAGEQVLPSPTGLLTGPVPTRRRARSSIHAARCAGYSPQAANPEAFRDRMQVFRQLRR